MTYRAKIRLVRAILVEIYTSLPGMKRSSSYEPPEDPLDLISENIYTGALNDGRRIRIWEQLLGSLFWLLWFGLGVYFWWFTEVPLLDYIIGVIVWGAIFLFTVVGIPVTRVILRNREQQ